MNTIGRRGIQMLPSCTKHAPLYQMFLKTKTKKQKKKTKKTSVLSCCQLSEVLGLFGLLGGCTTPNNLNNFFCKKSDVWDRRAEIYNLYIRRLK
jgi:hypothetical protein